MELPLFNDIIVIFGLSIVVSLVCHRLRLPVIVGFLITGVITGPYGLGLVEAVEEVEILAEIGIILLLFSIGIEFSFNKLLSIRKVALVGGSLQVLLTMAAASAVSHLFGLPLQQSLFAGFLAALSSTAIVLKLLQEKAEVNTPHGQGTLGVLIFQDIAVVPMLLVIPLLAGAAERPEGSLPVLVAKGAGVFFMMAAGIKWGVPFILLQVARTRNREVFLLTIIMLCLAVAWVTAEMGLSLALGAFLAGLIISESEYSHQALGSILPFKDVFTSFFFVSIGMLVDLGYDLVHFDEIALLAFGVYGAKALIVTLAMLAVGLPLRPALLVAAALGQIGEFSFVLSRKGVTHGLLSADQYQMFLGFSVLTMVMTPFIISLSRRLHPLLFALRGLPAPGGEAGEAEEVATRGDHLIIVGFGVTGRNVARAADLAGIPFVVVEMNPDTVRRETERGLSIIYGDAGHEAVLKKAALPAARVVVVAINDPAATRRITDIIRLVNPKVHLIVRTRYLSEMRALHEIGANEVIPEEFETSVEIFSRVLSRYLVPQDDLEAFIAEIRADGYEMLRGLPSDHPRYAELATRIPDVEVASYRLAGESPVTGLTLADIGLRKQYGVTVLAIRRGDETLSNPDGDSRLLAGDVVFLIGTPEALARAFTFFAVRQPARSLP